MNYKEKYEMALERAKKFIEENPLVQNLNTWIKETFPELKKSEDEKIIDAIKHGLKCLGWEHINDIRIVDMIDWLEKQGESSIKWNKNTKDCKPKVKHNVLMKTTHGIAEGEWQGEQWLQYRWSGIVRDTDVLSWIELSDLEKQGEQKPIEWDADDDDKFFFLKARLKDYEDCIIYDEELSMCQKNNVRETTKEFLEWLDTIKERIGG